MKTIYVQRSHPGSDYGHRIFVPYEHVRALKEDFDRLSTWQGSDKDTGKAKAWEFPLRDPLRLEAACHHARICGYAVEEISEANVKEVWP